MKGILSGLFMLSSLFFLSFISTDLQAQRKNKDFKMKTFEVKYYPQSQSVNLHWSVSAASLPTQYIIERSLDSLNYRMIGELSNPAEIEGQNYYYTDPDPVGGKTFYRIRTIINEDKQYVTAGFKVRAPISVMKIVHLFLSDEDQEVGFAILSPDSAKANVYISDALGAIKKTRDLQLKRGINRWSLSVDGFKPGVYFLQVNNKEDGNSVMQEFEIGSARME